jgi:hypothetical protein
MDKEQLSEKIQVLITPSDEKALYFLIYKQALIEDSKPIPISTYIRKIIKDHLKENFKTQASYADLMVEKIIEERKKKKE